MKIFMIMNGYGPIKGLPESHVFTERQIRSIKDAGHEVFVYYAGMGKRLGDIFRNFFGMKRHIKTFHPDIVHAQYGSVTGFLGVLVKNNVPLVLSFCGSDLLGACVGGFMGKLSVLMSCLSARYADRIIVKSRELYYKLPVFCMGKAEIIPNGVDIKLFAPLSGEEARKRIGLDRSKKVILFNRGRDAVIKDEPLALKAFGILKQSRKDVELVMLERLSPEAVPLYLSAADVLLLTSYYEGSSNIVKEALACNLPVVSVLCGDIEEMLEGVLPSKIVYDRDPLKLSMALDEVLSIGKRSNGREKISVLSIDLVAKKIEKVYFEVIGGKKKLGRP